MQAYSKMGVSDAQMQMLNSSPMFRGHVFLVVEPDFGGVVLRLPAWLKRYFKTPASTAVGCHAQPVEILLRE